LGKIRAMEEKKMGNYYFSLRAMELLYVVSHCRKTTKQVSEVIILKLKKAIVNNKKIILIVYNFMNEIIRELTESPSISSNSLETFALTDLDLSH
jgi:hypothetical protein